MLKVLSSLLEIAEGLAKQTLQPKPRIHVPDTPNEEFVQTAIMSCGRQIPSLIALIGDLESYPELQGLVQKELNDVLMMQLFGEMLEGIHLGKISRAMSAFSQESNLGGLLYRSLEYRLDAELPVCTDIGHVIWLMQVGLPDELLAKVKERLLELLQSFHLRTAKIEQLRPWHESLKQLWPDAATYVHETIQAHEE